MNDPDPPTNNGKLPAFSPAQLRAMLGRASPGPWLACQDGDDQPTGIYGAPDAHNVVRLLMSITDCDNEDDRELAQAAPRLAAQLLELLEREAERAQRLNALAGQWERWAKDKGCHPQWRACRLSSAQELRREL